jgi:hypothetical protein
LALFTERPEAEAEAARLERRARELANPFCLAPYDAGHQALTALSYEELRRRAGSLGLRPAGGKNENWPEEWWGAFSQGAWAHLWDECVDMMDEGQREGVWRMLGRLSMHDVAEVRLS